jgi:hypothetical protein
MSEKVHISVSFLSKLFFQTAYFVFISKQYCKYTNKHFEYFFHKLVNCLLGILNPAFNFAAVTKLNVFVLHTIGLTLHEEIKASRRSARKLIAATDSLTLRSSTLRAEHKVAGSHKTYLALHGDAASQKFPNYSSAGGTPQMLPGLQFQFVIAVP